MEGKLLLCRDCYKQFTFSVQDQIFYSSKRWDAPCRCPACRKKRKSVSMILMRGGKPQWEVPVTQDVDTGASITAAL